MTDDADLQPLVAADFLALADLLDSATEEQWDTPSLCEGWRVREVIAHMTMAARYPEDAFMAELRRYDFDFGRLSNEIAAKDAGLPAGVPLVGGGGDQPAGAVGNGIVRQGVVSATMGK